MSLTHFSYQLYARIKESRIKESVYTFKKNQESDSIF